MKPQKQLFRHRPNEGTYGDCHRTAIACVLDMDANEVPHFMDGGAAEDAHDRFERWLNDRGIATINVVFPGKTPLYDVLQTVAVTNSRTHPVFILGGQSRTGCNHSVVCCDGEIVCDPSQDDSGIVGPCDDGMYWLTFFGALHATTLPMRKALEGGPTDYKIASDQAGRLEHPQDRRGVAALLREMRGADVSETRTIHDPFLNKDVEISDRLVDRLRGKYATGPILPNGEPEFGWHQFPVPPIQQQAADEIERLRTALQGMVGNFKPFTMKPVGAPNSSVRAEQDSQIKAHVAAVAVLAGGDISA